MDLVDSLSYAKLAREKRAEAITISDSTYQADDLLAAEWKFLYKIKLSHEHLKCAAEIIEDYSKSQDEHIQTSAEGAAWVYRALITLKSELLKIDTSDDTAPRLSRGVFAEKIADLNLAMDKAWKLLVIPVIMSTAALIRIPEGANDGTRLSSFAHNHRAAK